MSTLLIENAIAKAKQSSTPAEILNIISDIMFQIENGQQRVHTCQTCDKAYFIHAKSDIVCPSCHFVILINTHTAR